MRMRQISLKHCVNISSQFCQAPIPEYLIHKTLPDWCRYVQIPYRVDACHCRLLQNMCRWLQSKYRLTAEYAELVQITSHLAPESQTGCSPKHRGMPNKCCHSALRATKSDPKECPSGAPRGSLSQISWKMDTWDMECARVALRVPAQAPNAQNHTKLTEWMRI